MRNVVILFAMFYSFSSCTENAPFTKTIKINDSLFIGEASIKKIVKLNKYTLTITNAVTGESDRIYTPYEVFQMNAGDVNHDGKTDICIGIIKPTPFDSVLKKRLFIFQIDRDYIRPLWLSSRLTRPLEKFALCKDVDGKCIIRAMERQDLDKYCINEYRWKSFGMSYVRECNNSLSYIKAQTLINNQ